MQSRRTLATILILAALLFAGRRAAATDAQLMLLQSASVEGALITDEGNVYARSFQGSGSILYQTPFDKNPHPIMTVGQVYHGATLSGITTSVPLFPYFNTDYAILSAQYTSPTVALSNRLTVITRNAGNRMMAASNEAPYSSLGVPNFGVAVGADYSEYLSRPAPEVLPDPLFKGMAYYTGVDTGANPNFFLYMKGRRQSGAFATQAQTSDVVPVAGSLNTTNAFRNSYGYYANPVAAGFSITGLINPNHVPAGFNGATDLAWSISYTPKTDSLATAPTYTGVALRKANQLTRLEDDLSDDAIRNYVSVFEMQRLSWNTTVVAGTLDPNPPKQAIVINSFAISNDAVTSGTCDCARADINGDGHVTGKDLKLWRKCVYTTPPPAACAGKNMDINHDGNLDSKDYDCMVSCDNADGHRDAEAVTPGFTNPDSGLVLLEAGDALPGLPGRTMSFVFGVRANGDGVAFFGVGDNLGGGAIYMIDDNEYKAVLSTGDNLGEGAITSFLGMSNVNQEGQIAITCAIGGNKAIYRLKGNAEGAAVKSTSWRLYSDAEPIAAGPTRIAAAD